MTIDNHSGFSMPVTRTKQSIYASDCRFLHSIYGAKRALEIADAYFQAQDLPLKAHKAKGRMTASTDFTITASDGSQWFFSTTSTRGTKIKDAPTREVSP